MKLHIYLRNSSQYSEKIRSALAQIDCTVEIENEQIVISTSVFTQNLIDFSNNDTIWEIGLKVVEFIDIINGAAIIEHYSLEKIELDHIKYEDSKGNKLHLPSVAELSGSFPPLLGGKPNISAIIPLALKDNAVAKVLRLCSKELDWSNLYRIWEVISEAECGLINDHIRTFKGSANCSLVSGDSSRHGKINVKMPQKTMPLNQAQNMIKNLASDWIFYRKKT